MLKNDIVDADLHEVKHTLSNHLSDELKQYIDSDDTIHKLEYPVIDYPLKVKSVNFDKQSEVEGRLWGIKGQYLLFENNQVLNIPISHGEGNYFADKNTVEELENTNRILFRYSSENGEISNKYNHNGSVNNIAGIINKNQNVLGMMPHPERSCEPILGSADGNYIFKSI